MDSRDFLIALAPHIWGGALMFAAGLYGLALLLLALRYLEGLVWPWSTPLGRVLALLVLAAPVVAGLWRLLRWLSRLRW